MENIKMWHHSKYYKELRKRNKTGVTATTKRDIGHSQELSFGFPPPVTSDQVISLCTATAASRRAPGSGLKQSNNAGTLISRLCNKRKGGIGSEATEASSLKPERQASSDKLKEIQTSSDKRQAPSNKRQAPSRKRQAP